jgi:soluble lytic murein transglycosylase-like protein
MAMPGMVAPGALSASPVRLGMGAEGRKVIYNESSEQRSRRFASTLLAVPALTAADFAGFAPANPSTSSNPSTPSPSRIDLGSLILRHSGAQRLDPRLVQAVIQVESGYNPRARSNKGAMGLMQLMPGTAVELAVANPFDADQNLRGGTAYLRQMIDRFGGSLELAVAAYNAGAGTVEHYRGVPPFAETLDYVERVLALYHGETPRAGRPAAATPATVASLQLRPHATRTPRVTRNSEGRLVVTTALGDWR